MPKMCFAVKFSPFFRRLPPPDFRETLFARRQDPNRPKTDPVRGFAKSRRSYFLKIGAASPIHLLTVVTGRLA